MWYSNGIQLSLVFITVYRGLCYKILKLTHLLSVGYRKEYLTEEIVYYYLVTRRDYRVFL
jgi:hypothetical protein